MKNFQLSFDHLLQMDLRSILVNGLLTTLKLLDNKFGSFALHFGFRYFSLHCVKKPCLAFVPFELFGNLSSVQPELICTKNNSVL